LTPSLWQVLSSDSQKLIKSLQVLASVLLIKVHGVHSRGGSHTAGDEKDGAVGVKQGKFAREPNLQSINLKN
jgi:hypothetical protein